MKNILYLICFLSIGFTACSDSNDGAVEEQKMAEGPLVEFYSKDMIANPTNQNHKDRNIIINHLIDNGLKYNKTASGIYYNIDVVGEGEHPNLNSRITAHYEGTLLDGQVFDSSYKKGQPLQFSLGQVVAGWQESIPMLKKGGKGTFFVPSSLAYGPGGFPGTVIGPNAVLKFEIEVINFR